jgi:hypothetical protein
MKTANEISNEKLDNKMSMYIDLATENMNNAQALFLSKKSFTMKMALDQLVEHYQKAITSDCEYTAYINAHATDVILSKMNIFIQTGRYE